MTRGRIGNAVAASLLFLVATTLASEPLAPPPTTGAAALGLVLRRLPVTTRLLYVTAHPDDEHNGLLVRLSRGQGIRTALLSLTRGEGGQNAVGRELGEALAVLRASELEAVHRYDGATQIFGRARDFGLSFSVEESLETWGHEATLDEVVRAIRSFRPDVVVTLPLEAEGGGQHHQAAARITLEAFRAAADAKRFPEHFAAGLLPWQPRKLYATGTGGASVSLPAPALRLSTGRFDPLLGATWEELGRSARARHRSQGMGLLPVPQNGGSADLFLLDAEPKVEGRETDITNDLPMQLRDLSRFLPEGSRAELFRAGLEEAEVRIEAARAAFDARDLTTVIAPLARATTTLERLRESLVFMTDETRAEVALRLDDTQRELHLALSLAHGLSIRATVDDPEVVRGQSFRVTLTVVHHGKQAIEVLRLVPRVSEGWTVDAEGDEPVMLLPGVALTRSSTVTVSRRASWTARGPMGAEEEPVVSPLAATITWRSSGATVTSETPITPFDVLPVVSLGVSPDVLVLPLHRIRGLEIRVAVRNHAPEATDASVSLDLPPGFRTEPAVHRLAFGGPDQERHVRFVLRPPVTLEPTRFAITARARAGDESVDSSVEAVDYPHITRRLRLRPARALLLGLDIRTRPGTRVGWIRGTGDVGGEAALALGLPCDALGPEDLAFGDLSSYTTILVGVRAYEARPDLRLAHGRILDWVRAGGHLVVQYQREAWNDGRAESPWAPYAASVTRRRLTDEHTPLEILVPEAPLLRDPNRIGPSDFDGWVQERGIQFLDARDARYVDLLAGEDPFPQNPGRKTGMLVTAAVGKGSWTYVGLGLFRQLPAGVPGAWRLLANLVSRPAPPLR